jgi:hypothetical protein
MFGSLYARLGRLVKLPAIVAQCATECRNGQKKGEPALLSAPPVGLEGEGGDP